ncbi:histidine--tRNA ligase [Rhodovastum atsumiense]|uniref:Histidine--tRNA ligase n=1 Tax=Rhodovastum atsumiense TaxID=504468 RepID=A0A5M6ITV4_9PROT|nr:histidine--tRNA ligase [Rhodovastum atsumiense]KAA5611359.1 histidine--tRNA ligase [Rhodovastum atsumiense]CAH2603651.1 histidine--tRNA ligase [Rhodovastum atsumiense]
MSEQLQPARGTRDLIGEDHRRHQHVIDTARRVAARYGLEEWATPIFEDTRVFARSLGDTSDVVMKEMYSFTDRGGDSLTLRPEMTAGVCRALVTNGLTQSLPQKVFYAGPMFRYERPQKGRYRQFHQIGAELLGTAEPLADAEVIACGWDILRELGLAADVVLELNTLGDRPSREAWRTALVEYFTAHRDKLSEDSLTRLERNPLRILDSKDDGDRRVVAGAPLIEGYLTPEAATFYQRLKDYLTRFGVPFVDNPRIVRGLDYYGHTAFEFVTSRLGAQGTVMAGGRYDGLVAEMGGPATPAVGWAAGVERLSMLLTEAPPAPRPVAVVPVGEVAEAAALDVLQALRQGGIRAEMAYRGNLKKRMERANRIGARAAVILGEAEVARGVAQVKDLATGAQAEVPVADLPARLR